MTLPPVPGEPASENDRSPSPQSDELASLDMEAFLRKDDPEEAQRARALQDARARRKPVVTWALAAAIAAMFALQHVFGGVDDPYVLRRLGGLAPDAVLGGGEPWRIVASAFLHAGVVHFALNTYVLWAVGRSLEPLVGSARLLVAYTVSVLVASAAALAFSNARLTVGASGGVFGLFGIEAVIAFLRPSFLPTTVRKARARGVALNLAINVVNSFRPNVAMAAHFGGGLAGFIVGLVLVPKTLEASAKTSVVERVGAGFCALVLAAGPIFGLHEAFYGRGATRPALVRCEVSSEGGMRATASIPAAWCPSHTELGPSAGAPEESSGSLFGDLISGPALLSFLAFHVNTGGLDELQEELRSSPPPDGYVFERVSRTVAGGRDIVIAHYRVTSGPVDVERAYAFVDPPDAPVRRLWVAEVAFWRSAGDSHRGLAAEIAASLEPGPETESATPIPTP